MEPIGYWDVGCNVGGRVTDARNTTATGYNVDGRDTDARNTTAGRERRIGACEDDESS